MEIKSDPSQKQGLTRVDCDQDAGCEAMRSRIDRKMYNLRVILVVNALSMMGIAASSTFHLGAAMFTLAVAVICVFVVNKMDEVKSKDWIYCNRLAFAQVGFMLAIVLCRAWIIS